MIFARVICGAPPSVHCVEKFRWPVFYHRDCASIDLPVVAIEREHVALVHDAITDP